MTKELSKQIMKISTCKTQFQVAYKNEKKNATT